MSPETIRITPRLISRGRAIALGALAALACSACASEETVATVPYNGGMAPTMAAANDPAKQVASKPPLGYPWANNGPSLPTASANAPTVTR